MVFSYKTKKQGVWGKPSHVAVKIDTVPPSAFTPMIETYTRIIGYQTMAYFEAEDNFSGINHYEVNIVSLDTPESVPSFFTEQISPYKIPSQKTGKYSLIVRAIDNAGNIREGETRFRIITPLISHIEGKGLQIKGLFLPWWLIVFLTLVFLILMGIIIFVLFRKKAKRIKTDQI